MLLSTSSGGTRPGCAVCARTGDATLKRSAQTAQAVFTADPQIETPKPLCDAFCLRRKGDLMVLIGQRRDNLGELHLPTTARNASTSSVVVTNEVTRRTRTSSGRLNAPPGAVARCIG